MLEIFALSSVRRLSVTTTCPSVLNAYTISNVAFMSGMSKSAVTALDFLSQVMDSSFIAGLRQAEYLR